MLRSALWESGGKLLRGAPEWRIMLSQTSALARANASMPAPQEAQQESRTFLGGITIGKVMQQKAEAGLPSANLFWVKPTDTVYDAVSKMAGANIGSIFVLKEKGAANMDSVAGLITERDYLRKVVVTGKSSREMSCGSLMTPTEELAHLGPGDSVAKAMQVMEEKNIRHIPVFDSGHLVGMMSIKDVMATIMQEHDRDMDTMTDYIGGNTY